MSLFHDKKRPLLCTLKQNLQGGFEPKAEKLFLSGGTCWRFPYSASSLLSAISGVLTAESHTQWTCTEPKTSWSYSNAFLAVDYSEYYTLLLSIFRAKNVHLYIKIQLFPIQDVGLRSLMRCQVISFTCHYILSRLLNPLMQSAVVYVSIYSTGE